MDLSRNGTSFMLFVRNLAIEVLVFMFWELVVRFIVPSPEARNQKLKLLTIQFCLLSASLLFLYLFHHTPFLLILVILFIFVRIISLSGVELKEPRDQHISRKPLANTRLPEKKAQYDDFHQPWNTSYLNNSFPNFNHQNSEVLNSGSLVLRGHQSSSNNPRRDPNSIPTPATNNHYSARITKTMSSFTPQNRVLYGGQNLQLNRSALRGQAVQEVASAKTSEYLRQQQQQQGYLQYVSSFWGKPDPSACPPGIYNSGNICFAISTLQALCWTPDFVNSLKSVCQQKARSLSSPNEKLQLLRSLYSVLAQCHRLPDGTSVYGPSNCSEFLKKVSKFVPYLMSPPQSSQRQTQQDASEFLLWLLDNLDGGGVGSEAKDVSDSELDSAKQKKDKCLDQLRDAKSSEITTYKVPLIQLAATDWILESQNTSLLTRDLFLGQMIEARKCQNCSKMSVNVEYFTLLPLPIPEDHSQLTIQDCFNRFGTVETLTSDNMMACSCSPVPGDSTEMILTQGVRLGMLSRLPRRLVIQLSRFSYNSLRKCAQKNTTPIRIPMTVDLSPYVMEYKLNALSGPGKKARPMEYTLYAVCIHTGAQSTSFGHYVTYCLAANGSWYCFNDSYVSPVTDMERELQDSLLLENAYLVLYKNIT